MQARERYTLLGPEGFGDGELLSLILGTGTPGQPVAEISRNLLDRFGGMGGLAQAPPSALVGVPGVGPARAVRIHAALQAGGRAARRLPREAPTLNTPERAWRWLRPGLEAQPVEELHALFLDRRSRLICSRLITRGSEAHTIVEPRQLFRIALQLSATALVVAHNHPSGDPTPSVQDREVTQRLASVGQVVGIPLLDHLVIGAGTYSSLAALGMIPAPASAPSEWVSSP